MSDGQVQGGGQCCDVQGGHQIEEDTPAGMRGSIESGEYSAWNGDVIRSIEGSVCVCLDLWCGTACLNYAVLIGLGFDPRPISRKA